MNNDDDGGGGDDDKKIIQLGGSENENIVLIDKRRGLFICLGQWGCYISC